MKNRNIRICAQRRLFSCKKKLISSPRCGAEWRLQFSCTSGVLGLLLNPNNQLVAMGILPHKISPDSELAENGRCPRSGFDTMILSEEGGTEIGADLLTLTFRRQGDPEKRICAQVLRFCAKKCSYQPVAPNQQYDRKERTTCSRPLLYCAR